MKMWRFAVATAVIVALSGARLAHADADVERAQKALKQSGHDPGPIDGVAGPRTTSALKAYQQANGLETTGQLDDATRAKLTEPAKSPSNTQTGGDARPSASDPAQATKTGSNVGEGASYSRSTQK
jgi:peptidoglycan hydrolase-like protein with peptidoglycan-binding domain